MKRKTNSISLDFQKTASILFYLNVKYVSVCYSNLCNGNEVVDLTRQECPPIVVCLQDTTSSLLLSNTLSLLLSNTLSSSSSNNSSRSSTSVRSKANSDNGSLFPSPSQSKKIGKSISSEIKHANYVISICNWAMGTRSESIYNNPHQEWCVGKMICAKMSNCEHKGCKVRVHNIYQKDWLEQHRLEVNPDDLIHCRQHNECYQQYV
jgi:hypothetical protein